MIRAATSADVPAIVAMAEKFWKLTAYDDPFEAEYVANVAHSCREQGLLLVLEIDSFPVGFIAGVQHPLLGCSSVTQVTEVAYWIEPEHRGSGLKLLDAFERAGAAVGAKYLNMIAMQSSNPAQATGIYLARNYRHAESTYFKILEGGECLSQQQSLVAQ